MTLKMPSAPTTTSAVAAVPSTKVSSTAPAGPAQADASCLRVCRVEASREAARPFSSLGRYTTDVCRSVSAAHDATSVLVKDFLPLARSDSSSCCAMANLW
ncbi:hypothetical protein P8C59_001614 [Phyllachora maydis]|uniref:Uncharacterized protein n=1 Tax=Phyllachora maydis TaxID=1825666 RepID=A0AAD9HZN9_9PEZI|nr:hypothetical protein P8C59_001614 [Phyllachora maydis]